MIGNFRLEGIPSAARGVPQIEVTFDIDVNGILHVTAKDKGSGKDQKIIIKGASGLSEEEVNRFKDEAKKNESEDKKKQEIAESKNQLDHLIYQLEKQLKKVSSEISDNKKKSIELSIQSSKDILSKSDSK